MGKLEKFILLGLLIAALLFARFTLGGKPYHGYIPEPTQTMLENPIQTNIEGSKGNIQLTLLAQYSVEGVIKSKEFYLLDYPSQISRYDFALAWGDLNNEQVDEHIRYSQSGRWYCYNYSEGVSVSPDYIAQHSANIHLIHRDGDILKKIIFAGEDSRVRLKGFLVNVNFKDGPWKTSLTRNDSGNGACEIMYVTSIEILD